jgi:hypothetical protein
MTFEFESAIPILTRTPAVLNAWLRDLPPGWTGGTEGPNTWSATEVVAHLIHGERTDWIPRVEHLLAHGDSVPFPPFDQHGHVGWSKGMSLTELLDTFAALRAENLKRLAALRLTAPDLDRFGRHPEFGRVTLRQLLSTWTAHDLNHVFQIARVMGRQYSEAVGPWRQYLKIIGGPNLQ